MYKKYLQSAWWLGFAILIADLFLYKTKATWGILNWILLSIGAVLIIFSIILNFSILREKVVTRSARYGLNMALMIIIVLGIIVFVDILTSKHSKRFDLTEEKRHTLSPQTQKVLRSLEEKIEVLYFYKPGTDDKTQMEDLLTRYNHYSNKLHYQFIDMFRNPSQAEKHKITTPGTAVIIFAGKTEKVFSYSEADLTNAIIKVTRREKKTIYFCKGHGESNIEDMKELGLSSLKTSLEQQYYEVKDVILAQEGFPKKCDLLIVPGPKEELFEVERKMIKDYILTGGNALFMLEPFSAPELVEMVNSFGFDVGNNIVVEFNPNSQILGGDIRLPVVARYEPHDITKGFLIMTFYPIVRSVRVKQHLPKGVTAQGLAVTSPQSWGETDKIEKPEDVKPNEGKDLMGPLTVAAAATIDINEFQRQEEEVEKEKEETEVESTSKKESRIVVFGDSDFAKNIYVHKMGNADLLLNSINWLTQEIDLISIKSKDVKSTPIILTATQGWLILVLPVVILPGAVLLVCIFL